MVRIWVLRVVAIACVWPWGMSAQAQQTDLKALLESFGFTVVEEDGRRTVEVTMRDVLNLALERNLALKSVRVEEMIAQSGLEAARERLNPTLTSTVDYGRELFPSLFFSPGGNFLTLNGTDTVTLSSEYSKPTESGIEYGLTFIEERTRSRSMILVDEGDDPTNFSTGDWLESSALIGSLTIPFAQDAGFEFNNIPVRRGEAGLTESRLTIRQRELDLMQATASTYWDLVAALEGVRVQRDAVKLSEQLLRDNRLRLEAGVLSPFDVQVTETQLARERERLLTAQSAVLRIEDQARALLNLEVIDFDIRPLDRPTLRPLKLDYKSLLEQVYAGDTQVRQLQSELETNNLDLLESRNNDRTDLDLELFYTLQGFSRNAVGGGVRGFSQTDLDGYGATLTWTLPLFDVTTREEIRQRTLERQQLELELASLRSDLNVRLQGVLRQIRLAEQEVQTARVAMRLAEERLRNEIERFKVGEGTGFEVSQSQQDATSARLREILARLRFERNFISLLVLTGGIYDQYDLTPSHP